MECEICSSVETIKHGVNCTSCARSIVYLTRLESVKVLLEKESLSRQIQSITRFEATEKRDKDSQKGPKVWSSGIQIAKREEIISNISNKRDCIQALKTEIKKMKDRRIAYKEVIASKRASQEAIRNVIRGRRQKNLNSTLDTQKEGTVSFDLLHNKTVDTKAFLCQEAASLLRLRQRRRMRSGTFREQYSITGLLLPDLREINGIRCTDLTAVLTSTARLLVLVAFYLGVRLPAEITLPHRDYPLATINTPITSYSTKKSQFPGSGSNLSIPSSPTASRQDSKPAPRPRPLFIGSDDREEKVAQVAKKDSAAFNFFLEAVSLLVWDLSWLCHTQGLKLGTESWQEACNIGQNLWYLILAPRPLPATSKTNSHQDPRQRLKKGKNEPSNDLAERISGSLGEKSHSSAHNFLGAAPREPQTTWRLNKHTMIFDPLKKILVTEMNNAEWELLEEQEWDDGGEQFDEAVFIKTRAMDGREYDDARSIMTTRTHISEDQEGNANDGARMKSKSGWTKVKNRDKT